MHRFTLGLAILAVGTLIALPFRKSPESKDDGDRPPTPLKDLDLMVLEVTENVQAPVLFEAREDERNARQPESGFALPLTYQDLAVPLEGDSVFESKFNATAEVVAAKRESDRLAQLEQRFAEKSFSSPLNSSRADSPAQSPSSAAPQATLASASSPDEPLAADPAGPVAPEVSVLQPLPPAGGRPTEGAKKHWIRQPD
ncbi:MAG: hypothetical protein AAFU85_23645 [Planctomycetota bacterium]